MPLFWLSLSFLLGIAAAAAFTLPTSAWLILSAAALALLVLWRPLARLAGRGLGTRLARVKPVLPLPLFLLFFCLGAARYQAAQPVLSPSAVAWYNDLQTPLVIEGWVADPPDVRDGYTQLRVAVEQLHLQGELLFVPVKGLLLARVPPDVTGHDAWHYGDRVRLEGQLGTPPQNEAFSYREYLARQGIYSYMSTAQALRIGQGRGNVLLRAVYAFKAQALATVYQLYPDPEASLLAGILLGVETGIPKAVQAAFTATGTSHLIAISGFNMTLIAGLLTSLFGRLLGWRRGAVVAALGIGLYTLLVGATPSVARAALIAGLSLFARQVGRRQEGLNSLAFVAALMTLVNPHLPWDVGFQLSFAATLGLILFAQPLSSAAAGLLARRLPGAAVQKVLAPLSEYFLFTLAAQSLTLLVIAYHFGSLSWSAFLVNPLVLPAQPAVMTLGGLAVLLGLLFLPLGQIAAYLAWPFVLFTVRVVEAFAALGDGLNLGDVPLMWIMLIFAAILAVAAAAARFPAKLDALRRALALPALLLTGCALAAVLVWRIAFSAPDGRLHVTLLPAGSGDGLIIHTPAGRSLLIDGGPSTTALSDALGRRLSPFDRRLDWLVVAAPGEESLGALPRALARFPARAVLWAGPTHATRASRDLWETLIGQGLAPTYAQSGHQLDLGDGAVLQTVAVSRRGALLLIQYDCFRLLLPVGITFETLADLEQGRAIGPVSALLLADSGYAPANPPEWIAALRPQLILLSVAVDDPYGLPDPDLINAIAAYPLLRTDRNGWIELTTDGQQMWVEVEKK